MDLQTTHHASLGVNGNVNSIQTDETVSAREFDFDDSKVVNMVEILPNTLFGEFGTATANDYVAGCSLGYLASNMTWKYELAVTPLDVNLEVRSVHDSQVHVCPADLLACS